MQEKCLGVGADNLRSKLESWLIASLFGILLSIPLLAQLFGGSMVLRGENRVLAPFPVVKKMRELKDLPKKLEIYVNDRFGLRHQLVYLNSLFRYQIGLSSNRNIAIGKDGWLFYTADKLMEQHRALDVFKSSELEHWIRAMEAVREWLEKRDVAFYILIAPDKNTLYPEKLPQYPRRSGIRIRYDQLVERLRYSKIDFVDPRSELLAAKSKGEAVYFEGDSHWTQVGAFVAYKQLMRLITKRFSSIEPLKDEDYEVSMNENPVSDLATHLGLEGKLKFRAPKMTLKKRSHQTGSVQTIHKPGWGWRVTITPTDLADAPRLLVFGDSFTDYILGPQMLYENFQSPVWTHHNAGTFNLELVKEYKPNVVVVQMADRYLRLEPLTPIGMD